MSYYLDRGEEDVELEEEDLRESVRRGDISLDSLICQPGWSEWKSIREVFPDVIPDAGARLDAFLHDTKAWVLIDTETTGLESPVYALEICAQRFSGFKPVGEPFHAFLNPGVEVPPDAVAVHGYTTEFIREHGRDSKIVYEELSQFVGEDPVVSHFLRYDGYQVLLPEAERLGLPPVGSRGFCTWKLCRRALPEHSTHKLDFLRDFYGLKCSRPHSASGDVESVVDLLARVVFPRLNASGYTTIDDVWDFSELTPLLLCKCIVQGLDFDEESRIVQQKRAEIKKARECAAATKEPHIEFLQSIELGLYPLPDLILEHELIEEYPEIEFTGQVFMFTGKMKVGTRAQVAEWVQARGGLVSKAKQITKEIDYLVLGEDPEKGWESLSGGRKLRKAFVVRLTESDYGFRIVREEDFLAGLRLTTA